MQGRAQFLADTVTRDALLDGQVALHQPTGGYRVAADTVLLAASVPAAPGQRIFEPGAGTGAAALCLAHRVEGCHVTGIEMQSALVRLAGENVRLNAFGGRVEIMQGDITGPMPPRLSGGFDHVMINPPFGRAGAGNAPPDESKAMAHVEAGAELADWIACGLTQLRRKGSLTLIHRADRLDSVLAALTGKAGEIVVFPLWPGEGKPARRVIVRARKGVATPLCLSPGLVLHGADGAYTPAAEAILRGGPLHI